MLTVQEALPQARLRRQLVRRAERAYDTEAWTDGLAWYRLAHDEAQALADQYGATVEQAAGVIAALSPQVGWSRNLGLVDEMLRTGTAGHYAQQVDKARRILAGSGQRPDLVLRGPKTHAFFRNICYPGQAGPVTIDRHALRIAAPSAPDRILDRQGAYEHVADQYRAVAERYGILPHELQAALWVHHRRLDGTEERYG